MALLLKFLILQIFNYYSRGELNLCLKNFVPILLVSLLVFWSQPLLAQSTSQDSKEQSPQIEQIKVPNGLTLPPSLVSLNQVMNNLGETLVKQQITSQTQIEGIKIKQDSLTTTSQQLDSSSTQVQNSLDQATQAVQTASGTSIKQSSTLINTTQTLQDYNSSVDKTESDMQKQINQLKTQNWLYGGGGLILGFVVFEGLHLFKVIP